jgi:hypothetical protein
MPKKAKRVVVVADMHCGHRVGLTPPGSQMAPQNAERRKWANAQKKLWDFYAETIDSLRPIDVLLVNGDCIDGRGSRSGGMELAFPNQQEQCDIAAECINYAKAKTIVMSRGTDYHTGLIEEYEDDIARLVGAKKIGNHEWVNVNGLMFDLKHHVGTSQIPHGRHTAIARDRLWGLLWAERDQAPKGDIFLRSHVHFFSYCGAEDWLAMTTPALQGLGGRYGSKRLSGTVDFGLVSFDVDKNGGYTWQAHVTKSAQKSRAILA